MMYIFTHITQKNRSRWISEFKTTQVYMASPAIVEIQIESILKFLSYPSQDS